MATGGEAVTVEFWMGVGIYACAVWACVQIIGAKP
jgi:hypothetical protein